jgi:glyoxylase-like metal-dependent hydrolase (beta-lactamase superfamily II)
MKLQPFCDAAGTFPEPLELAFPGSGLHGDWPLHVHCFLLRVGGATVLVDTGTGPAWAPATRWFGRPGRLLDELSWMGVAPYEVTHVVLTHLHLDHVGWVVHGSADHAEITFVNARHIVQRAELDLEHLGGLYTTHVLPMIDSGVIEVVDGVAEPVPGMQLVPTPGHTIGHQSVVVDTGAERLVICGDVFVHPAQVHDPALVYAHEEEPELAEATRRALLADAAGRPTVIAPAHFEATLAWLDVAAHGPPTFRVRTTCEAMV